ncbi:MAG: hypothetical protein Q6373_012210, partial [Candidatus Sigynarchaeota archaeon]
MSREAVFSEAEQILAEFPDFWAVDENIYHLFGVIQKTGVKQYTVEIYFPNDFPASAPQIRISKEIAELLGKQIELKTLSNWKKGVSRVVDILKELKLLIEKSLEMDVTELKIVPKSKESAQKAYAEFATPEPFEFQAAGDKPSGVKAVPRPSEGVKIKTVAEPEDEIKVFIPDGKRWSEEGLEKHKAGSEGDLDESAWTSGDSGGVDAGTEIASLTGDPEKDAALRAELDKLMTEYSIDYTNIADVNIYLTISVESTFIIHINYLDFPERPKIDLPDDLKTLIPNPYTQLASLRDWNPAYPPSIVDVVRELESRLWSLNEIEAKLKRIFGEFEAAYIPNSKTAVKVTILTFGFQEFHVTIDLKDFPRRPAVLYSQNLAAL